MDLFTHLIIAYLVSFGITWGHDPVYIAAGALAGTLPDADILLMPLARRFPLLRHHGITHSFLGVTVIAAGGALLGPMLVPGAEAVPLLLFMEVGGLLHIFLDGFTHFSVPPLAPFSRAEMRLDADRAVNLGTLIMSLVSFTLLLEERNAVPLATWRATGWVLLGVYLGYLALRGLARWAAGRAMTVAGYTAVVPTGNPLAWFLVDEKEGPDHWEMGLARFEVGRGIVSQQKRLAIHLSEQPHPPISDPREALVRSYLPAMKRSRFLSSSYRYADVKRQGDGFLISWFSLEYLFFGRAPGVLARVDARTGAIALRGTWFNTRRLEGPLSSR